MSNLHLVTLALIRSSALHNVSAIMEDLPRLEIQKLAPSVTETATDRSANLWAWRRARWPMQLSCTAASNASLRRSRSDGVGFRESASDAAGGRGDHHLAVVHHCCKVDQRRSEAQRGGFPADQRPDRGFFGL